VEGLDRNPVDEPLRASTNNALSNRKYLVPFQMGPSPSEKDKSQALRTLSQVPLFAGLKGKQLKSIAGSFSRQRSYEAGEVIEKEGEMGVAFYVVADGSVDIRRGGRRVSKLGRGQFFGEMALIERQPRSATVVAGDSGAKCLLMPVWSFKGAIEKDPALAFGVMRELARRLRETTKALGE